MGKFLAGTAFGLMLSVAYVWFDVKLPDWIELPDTFQRSLKAAATDDTLYNLDAPPDMRQRALEVYFANQAKRAAVLDGDLNHPLLRELMRRRAVKQAQQLNNLWSAYDKSLNKPALRRILTTKHGNVDNNALKRRMLLEALNERPFLVAWIKHNGKAANTENVRERLVEIGRSKAP